METILKRKVEKFQDMANFLLAKTKLRENAHVMKTIDDLLSKKQHLAKQLKETQQKLLLDHHKEEFQEILNSRNILQEELGTHLNTIIGFWLESAQNLQFQKNQNFSFVKGKFQF